MGVKRIDCTRIKTSASIENNISKDAENDLERSLNMKQTVTSEIVTQTTRSLLTPFRSPQTLDHPREAPGWPTKLNCKSILDDRYTLGSGRSSVTFPASANFDGLGGVSFSPSSTEQGDL